MASVGPAPPARGEGIVPARAIAALVVLLVLGAALLGYVGWQAAARRDPLGRAGSREALRTAATELIPAGTSVSEARRRLEARGFTCYAEHRGPLPWPVGKTPASGDVPAGASVVSCGRDVQRLLGTRASLRLGLVHADGTVRDVLADVAFIGL